MKVIIRTIERKMVDYIIDCLSGNYGWEPIEKIDPSMVARFIYQVIKISEKAELYDIVLTDNCRMETKCDFVTLKYREHLASLDRKDFERIEIL